jgi:hypothetical protein
MFDSPAPDWFAKVIPKFPSTREKEETIAEKTMKAYAKLKQRAAARKGRRHTGTTVWNPNVNDLVLVRTQPMSDASKGITGKFIRPYQGPWKVTNILTPSIFEITDQQGKIRGVYNKKSLKPFRSETV